MRLTDVPSLRNFTHAELRAFAMAHTPGVRLTLTQGLPITTADVTGAATIYVEPVNGGIVPLFSEATGLARHRIMLLQPSTLTLPLGTLASAVVPNDVFLYDAGAGSVGVEKLAWTSQTARATALALINGRYYKNADASRLYVGTFYPISTTQTEDSERQRFLWNMYNRFQSRGWYADTNSHAYNAAAWRRWNNAATAQVEFVTGLAQTIRVSIGASMNASGSANTVIAAVDLDAVGGLQECQVMSQITTLVRGGAAWVTPVVPGYHYVPLLEYSNATATNTFGYGYLGVSLER